MNDSDPRFGGNPQSTAKIAGHPLHPMLIPFPIVCFVGTLVTDIVYSRNHDAGWATASHWLLGIGLLTAAAAALAGFTDYLGDERVRKLGDALKHMLANVTAVVLELVNFFLRLRNNDFIDSTGVYLSAVVVLILLYSGWKGGDLVYRHRIGVNDGPNA
ncbi:putative membrane protein [Sphingomonas sp. F9_3S_D5_B_2]